MPSPYTRRVFLLVTVAAAAAFRTRYGQDIDAAGAAKTCIQPLSLLGTAPATHYAASMQLTEAQFAKLTAAVTGRAGVQMWEYDPDADAGFPYRTAAAQGLQWITDPGAMG